MKYNLIEIEKHEQGDMLFVYCSDNGLLDSICISIENKYDKVQLAKIPNRVIFNFKRSREWNKARPCVSAENDLKIFLLENEWEPFEIHSREVRDVAVCDYPFEYERRYFFRKSY